jgi:hypothetical protein
MSEGKCPFLETKTVTFCKAFPVKMIPVDRAISAKGICNSSCYKECSLFQERSRPKAAVEEVRGFRYRSDYHLHPKHLWLYPSAKENAVTFLIHSGTRTVRMVSPASGIVADVNRQLASEPSLVNRDPYQAGWIFSMEVQADGLKGLFHGNSIQQWLSWEVERLQRAFTSELGITATDGGEILVDIGEKLSDPQWERVANLFIG